MDDRQVSVKLRPIRRSDVDTTLSWRNDPELCSLTLSYRFPVTREAEERWITSVLDNQARDRMVLGVVGLENDRLLGYVGLSRIDWFDRVAEVGILIGSTEDRGRHVGRSAVETLLRQAFDSYGLNRVYAQVASYNVRGLALFDGLGFVREGVMRQHVFRDGCRHDVVLFGLTVDDYRSGDATVMRAK